MMRWLIVAFLCAAPLCAQNTDSGGASSADKKGEKSSTEGYNDKKEGPLDFSPNKLGWGLSARGGAGYDTNIFKEDRHEDAGWFIDGRAAAFFGVNIFDAIQLGVEAKIHGRLYFGQDDANDANIWELFGAAFLEHRVTDAGTFGGGVRVEGLYDQQQFYEIYGPITRQDDLRRVQLYARTWFDWLPVKWLLLDWGLYARLTEFTEDQIGNFELPSNDSWLIGADFRPELRFWDFLNIGPYILFEYEWFRDQFDIHPDTLASNSDKLQLLRYEFGAQAKLRIFSINQTSAKIYARRQDDSAQGFFRYWQYGLAAQTNFNLYLVRIGGGIELWTREYDARRIDPAQFTTNSDTVFERFFSFNVELAVNFFWTIEAGARYKFERRTSLLDNEGYVAHEIMLFLGFDW